MKDLKRKLRAVRAAFAALAALAGCGGKADAPVYEFTTVTRGTIEKTVSSTGTLNPVATVKVMSRMSGSSKVEKIHADYNDVIRRGDVLAELNTDEVRLKRTQQAAQVTQNRADYELELLNYQYQRDLAAKNLISEFEFKTSAATLAKKKALLDQAEADLKTIDLQINQYAFITSPIDGIVLERNINVGDTVVDSTSSNSSSVFTIAENLEEMQIESWVGELDIASIREGQEVRFTLESLPGRRYSGVVGSKRLMPSVQDNVVSYSVIINVDNSDGSLLPGMTCTVEFIEERNEDALLVPNAALRFSPASLQEREIAEMVFNAGLAGMSEEEKAAAVKRREETRQAQVAGGANANSGSANATGGLAGMLMPSGGMMRGGPGGDRPGSPGAPPGAGTGSGSARRAASGSGGAPRMTPPKPLWYLDGEGRLACVLLRTGMSDGAKTEIHPAAPGGGDSPLEGMTVILREKPVR
jgi:HlyD family secretion protein